MNQSINTDSKNSKEPQQKYSLGTVRIKILGGLIRFYRRLTSPSASVCPGTALRHHSDLLSGRLLFPLRDRISWIRLENTWFGTVFALSRVDTFWFGLILRATRRWFNPPIMLVQQSMMDFLTAVFSTRSSFPKCPSPRQRKHSCDRFAIFHRSVGLF